MGEVLSTWPLKWLRPSWLMIMMTMKKRFHTIRNVTSGLSGSLCTSSYVVMPPSQVIVALIVAGREENLVLSAKRCSSPTLSRERWCFPNNTGERYPVKPKISSNNFWLEILQQDLMQNKCLAIPGWQMEDLLILFRLQHS